MIDIESVQSSIANFDNSQVMKLMINFVGNGPRDVI